MLLTASTSSYQVIERMLTRESECTISDLCSLFDYRMNAHAGSDSMGGFMLSQYLTKVYQAKRLKLESKKTVLRFTQSL